MYAGRARSAVQILVRAPDRQVGPVGVERDRDRAGAVAEVPQRQRAGIVREALIAAIGATCAER